MTEPSRAPLYRERLVPSPGVWAAGILLGAAFGVILVPISPIAALVAGIVLAISACAGLWASSPVLEVTEQAVVMGRARIEPELLGAPQVLDVPAMREAMSTGFEPLAFHCTRGWVRTGVRVPVLDPADPAPAWVASSRDPQALAGAIERAALRRPRTPCR